jgi:hypothetical protein
MPALGWLNRPNTKPTSVFDISPTRHAREIDFQKLFKNEKSAGLKKNTNWRTSADAFSGADE